MGTTDRDRGSGAQPSRRSTGLAWLSAAAIAVLAAGCATSVNVVTNRPSQRFGSTGASAVSEESLRGFYRAIRRSFGDTIDTAAVSDGWARFHRQIARKDDTAGLPFSAAMSVALHLLSDANYTVFTLAPPTGEGLRSLVNLPVVACLLERSFDPKHDKRLDRHDLLTPGFAGLNDVANQLSLHVVRSIRTTGGRYTATTGDTLSFTDLAADTVVGQVFASVAADSMVRYHQNAGLFCVTQLPEADLNGEIAEWFNLQASTVTRPKVVVLR